VGRASADLRFCAIVLVGSVVVLLLVVGALLANRPLVHGASQMRAERWMLAAIAVVAGALAFVSGRFFTRRSARRPRRRLVIDRNGISFETGSKASEQVVDFSRPFGLTLLGNEARERIVLAVTTSERALYVAARAKTEDRLPYRNLLASACTVADEDAVLDATGPDGAPLLLAIADLGDLVDALLVVDGAALDRCFLSDARGAPVVLDPNELRLGRKAFDLRAPLEWHATLFQEPVAPVVALSDRDVGAGPSRGILIYQATWVRQGSSEAVLVSVLSSLPQTSGPVPLPSGEAPEITSSMLRDLRLMQANADSPPPADLRVAIEHMYMPRLRRALDRAPRASHKDMPSGTAAP
jgi:hypothetical protein